MKRTLTGIAAAAMVLGTMAPAAFAATTAPALTSGGGKNITLDGTTLYKGVQVGTGKDAGTPTTYFPIWYLQQALNQAGYTNTYDPSSHVWNLQIPGVDGSKVAVAGGVGVGNSAIAINGFVVKKFNAQWNKDLAGGPNAQVTTYFPVYYLGNVLAAAGFSNAWDGTNFGFTSNYGAAAGATLTAASSSVVANGVSTDTVTVAVVDAKGHIVRNFNGYATVDYAAGTGSNGAVAFYNPATQLQISAPVQNVAIKNGVGTVTVQSKGNNGVTDTLAVTHVYSGYGVSGQLDDSTWTLGTVSIGTTAQVASSIKMTSDYAVLANNNGGEANNVYAEVDDQTGNPMLSGTYPVTFTLTGPATFSNTTTTATSAGWGSAAGFSNASATLVSEKGVNGSLSVTATAGSLSGHLNVTEAGAQTASKLAITGPTAAQTTDGPAGNYTVTLEDNNGLPVVATTAVPVTITTTDTVTGDVTVVGTGSIASGSSTGTFTLSDIVAEKLTITAASAGLTSGTLAETFSTGAPKTLTFSNITTVPKAVNTSSTSTTLTVSVSDLNGNAIPVAGTEVDLTVDATSTGLVAGHAVTVNGTTISTAAGNANTLIKGYTDANGVASFNIAPQGYAGDHWLFSASAPAQSNIPAGIAAVTGANEGQINVVNQLGSSITAGYTDTTAGGVSKTNFTSGDTAVLVETVKDANGNPVVGDQVKVTFSNPSAVGTVNAGAANTTGVYSINTDGNGHATFTFTATGAGSTTVSAVDTASGSTGSSSFSTAAGTTAAGIAFFDANGKLVSSTNEVNASAGTVTLTAKVVDSNGNPIVAPNAINFDFGTVGSGTWRLSNTGSAKDVAFATIPAGSAGLTVYYVNGATGDVALLPTGTIDIVLGAPSYDATTKNVWAKVTSATPVGNLSGVVVKFTNTTAGTTYTATTDANGYAYFNDSAVNGTDSWTVTIVGTTVAPITGVLASDGGSQPTL